MEKQRSVFIILTDTGTVLTKMIRLYTKAPLNHASIAFDSELTEVFSFGRKKLNNPFVAGLVKEDLYDPFFEHSACAVYGCPVTERQYKQLYSTVKKMEQCSEMYKYHLLGLFGVLLNKKIERKNAYFCSHFVATLFEQNRIPLVDKPAYLVTPSDLALSSRVHKLYEGTVGDCLNTKRRIYDMMHGHYVYTNDFAQTV